MKKNVVFVANTGLNPNLATSCVFYKSKYTRVISNVIGFMCHPHKASFCPHKAIFCPRTDIFVQVRLFLSTIKTRIPTN